MKIYKKWTKLQDYCYVNENSEVILTAKANNKSIVRRFSDSEISGTVSGMGFDMMVHSVKNSWQNDDWVSHEGSSIQKFKEEKRPNGKVLILKDYSLGEPKEICCFDYNNNNIHGQNGAIFEVFDHKHFSSAKNFLFGLIINPLRGIYIGSVFPNDTDIKSLLIMLLYVDCLMDPLDSGSVSG